MRGDIAFHDLRLSRILRNGGEEQFFLFVVVMRDHLEEALTVDEKVGDVPWL
jgi:hypothetical protein